MSLLEHPTAQALLADAEVSADDIRCCARRLRRFLQRYLPCFYRQEQRELAQVVLEGKFSHLQRKTCEPIAYRANRPRKPLPNFVGAGAWDDEAVMAQLRRHVAEEFADADAVLVLDPHRFPQEGHGLLWCSPAVVWPPGQSRQLPGGSIPDLCHGRRLCSPGPATVSAPGLGRG